MDEQQSETGTTEQPAASDSGETADLGDAGKRALAAERQRAAEAERTRKAAEKRAADLEAELTKLRDAGRSDTERAIEKARRDAETAARKDAFALANRRILTAEIRAAAGGKLADPLDAVRLLDLESFEIGEDGEIDSKAIGKAIDDLLSAKPYLAANAKRFQGSGDGGARSATESAEIAPGLSRLVAAYSKK